MTSWTQISRLWKYCTGLGEHDDWDLENTKILDVFSTGVLTLYFDTILVCVHDFNLIWQFNVCISQCSCDSFLKFQVLQGLPIIQCPLRRKRKEKLLRKKIGLTKVGKMFLEQIDHHWVICFWYWQWSCEYPSRLNPTVLQSSFSDSFCRASVVAAIVSWMQLSDHCLFSCVYCAECRGYCHSNAWLAELQTFNQTILLETEASAKLFIYNNYVHLIWVFHHCYTTTTKGHFTLRVKTMKVWVQTTPYWTHYCILEGILSRCTLVPRGKFGFKNCMECFDGLGPRKFGIKMVPCKQ